MVYVHNTHSFKWGFEIRLNKDATIFGTNPSGVYSFGGGTAYSPVEITSASGLHNIQPGDPLPDALTGLLTATPYSYTITAAASVTPKGDKFDEAAVRREAYNFYFQDAWKPFREMDAELRPALRNKQPHQGSQASHIHRRPIGPDGKSTSFLTPGATKFSCTIRSLFIRWTGTASLRAFPSTTPSLLVPCSTPAALSPRSCPICGRTILSPEAFRWFFSR